MYNEKDKDTICQWTIVISNGSERSLKIRFEHITEYKGFLLRRNDKCYTETKIKRRIRKMANTKMRTIVISNGSERSLKFRFEQLQSIYYFSFLSSKNRLTISKY